MVQLMTSGNLPSDLKMASHRNKLPMKLEIEDPLEEEHGLVNKRCKCSSNPQDQRSATTNTSVDPSARYNIVDEPSPLGLQLRKSPSLLDLIQMKLSQGSVPIPNAENEYLCSEGNEENRGTTGPGTAEKLKASNFPASLLRIGSWEYKSRYEGDLVGKCYFAKHKIVWEVLDSGLKSKIEIRWSDIMALKANCPDTGPSTLTVVLARQPLFFRETNPQPRKHTLYQATADFTNGQASKHRRHFLQCPQGLLSKHFEKLIQCDMRLNFLSCQPEIILDSMYFEEPDNFKDHDLVSGKESTNSGFQDIGSSHASQTSSFMIEHSYPPGMTLDSRPQEAPSPSSVMDCRAIEGNGNSEIDSKDSRNWDQIKLPGIHVSLSWSDFMSQIEYCISEQMTSGYTNFSGGAAEYQEILDEIAQELINNQSAVPTDEKTLMSRINSFCCLLQTDPDAVQNSNIMKESTAQGPDVGNNVRLNYTPETTPGNKNRMDVKAAEEDIRDVSGGKQTPGMSRQDSFGDLLLHLPRIASQPEFLFNISEDKEGRW